jgi:serine/threonine protein kinase
MEDGRPTLTYTPADEVLMPSQLLECTESDSEDDPAAGQAACKPRQLLPSKYKKGKEIGYGAMKFVHACNIRDTCWIEARHGREEKFRNEIKILHQLQHEHIMPIIDDGFLRLDAIYVMIAPLMSCDLSVMSKFMSQERTLTVYKVTEWAQQILDALKYIHQVHSIVHGDIKPDNILIDEQTNRVKLTDFGLSFLVKDCNGNVGTPGYMAPEIGNGTYGTPVDVFGFGMMMCEIWTGVWPFHNSNNAHIQQIMLTAFQNQKDPIPPELQCIKNTLWTPLLKHCLKVNPAARPSASELYMQCCQALQGALSELIVHPTPKILKAKRSQMLVRRPRVAGAKRRVPG